MKKASTANRFNVAIYLLELYSGGDKLKNKYF